jgi:hypothetical protein
MLAESSQRHTLQDLCQSDAYSRIRLRIRAPAPKSICSVAPSIMKRSESSPGDEGAARGASRQ